MIDFRFSGGVEVNGGEPIEVQDIEKEGRMENNDHVQVSSNPFAPELFLKSQSQNIYVMKPAPVLQTLKHDGFHGLVSVVVSVTSGIHRMKG